MDNSGINYHFYLLVFYFADRDTASGDGIDGDVVHNQTMIVSNPRTS
jgi:hypothetical protein